MLPFILLGFSVVAGALGVGAAIDAVDKFNKAKRIAERAKNRLEREQKEVQKRLKSLEPKLNQLGRLYTEIYTQDFKMFAQLLRSISNTELVLKSQPKELKVWMKELPRLETNIDFVEKALEGALKGTFKGGMNAFFTYIGVTGFAIKIGTASTGTALSALSGAALENALLAWFGGGSLAAGGLGVAGGAFVLGGIVAGPAICIAGFTLNKQAEKALTEAKEYEKEVQKAIAQMTVFEKNLKIVEQKVEEELQVLPRLRGYFLREMELTEKYFNLARSEIMFRSLRKKAEKEFPKHLQRALVLGKTLKEIISQPLITDREKFLYNTLRGKALENAKRAVRNYSL